MLGMRTAEARVCAHTYEGNIVVLGRPQANRQDPVSEGALNDRPGHDATLRRMLGFPCWPGCRVFVDDVPEVVGLGDPLPVFEDLRLERHAALEVLPRRG